MHLSELVVHRNWFAMGEVFTRDSPFRIARNLKPPRITQTQLTCAVFSNMRKSIWAQKSWPLASR